MKTLLAVLALALALGSAAPGRAQAATVVPYEQGAFQTARQGGGPILIFVEAPWCPTCAKERPILQQLYAAPEFADLRVFTVDFDTSKPLLRELGVQMQSTLIAYRGTKETGRLTGATDPAVIKAPLETTVAN